MTTLDDNLKIQNLLINLKVDLIDFSIKPIGLGKNNRTYLVVTCKKKYLAKFYFSSLQDQRAKLNNEYNFLKYAQEIGDINVPKPLIKSDLYNLGIYEFIEGRPFLSSDLNENNILKAASFLSSINISGHFDKAKRLNFASDAFLDLDKSISQIDERVLILDLSIKQNEDSKAVIKFVKDLQHVWSNLKLDLRLHADSIINNNELCVSPSDFGFHNTLLKKDKLFFLDFEYAGRDDPAKVLADFFIQPEIKVSMDHMTLFANKAFDFYDNKEIIIERAKKLFPLFKVKWCCIIMNEFLPETAKRRLFSNPEVDIEQSKIEQLKKAQRLLLGIN